MNGRPKEFSGTTLAGVQGRLEAAKVAISGGMDPFVARKTTLGAHLTQWLKTTRASWRVATFNRAEALERVHVRPHAVAGVSLAHLRAGDIRTLLADLETKGVGARTRQQVRGLIHKALGSAARDGLIQTNVASLVDKPKSTSREIQPLDAEQTDRLISAAQQEPGGLGNLYVLAVKTGLRLGELTALRWADVDLKVAKIFVNATLSRDANGELLRTPPKTKRSSRSVDLDHFGLAALKDQKQWSRLLPGGWIFPSVRGGPMPREEANRGTYRRILKRADCPPIRFHDLRHTHATQLLLLNVHPKIVQERLGHSSIAITLDLYSHYIPSMGRTAADAMNRMLA